MDRNASNLMNTSNCLFQGYALCALDYEFLILDNAFLVHKPGIKVLKKDPKRAMLAAKTNQLIKKIIYPELQVMYGVRKGCAVQYEKIKRNNKKISSKQFISTTNKK